MPWSVKSEQEMARRKEVSDAFADFLPDKDCYGNVTQKERESKGKGSYICWNDSL